MLERLQALEREFDDFRKTTSIERRNGERTSIHRENADRLLGERQQLQMVKTRLESRLQAAQDALKENLPLGAVLMTLIADDERGVSDILVKDPETGASVPRRLRCRGRTNCVSENYCLSSCVTKNSFAVVSVRNTRGSKAQSDVKVAEAMIREVERNEEIIRKQIEEARDVALTATPTADNSDKLRELIRLHALAAKQRLQALDKELSVINEQYRTEMEIVQKESTKEIRWDQLDREIKRQQDLYDRIMARLDELNIMQRPKA